MLFFLFFFLLFLAQCLNNCPSHSYPDSITDTCQTCDSSCVDCNFPGTSSNCTSCPSGSFLQTATGPARCLATCPSSTYQDTINNICQTCDPSCDTCQSPGDSSSCLSCPFGSFLQSIPGPSGSFLLKTQGPTQCMNIKRLLDNATNSTNGTSNSTSENSTNSTNGTSTNATNRTYSNSTNGTTNGTTNGSNGTNSTCDYSCEYCVFPNSSSSCTSCKSGYFLQSSPGPSKCLITCPTNTYTNTTNNLCQPCDNSCASCQPPGNSTSCTNCTSGYFLQSAATPNQCLTTCPPHTYKDKINAICLICDPSCKTCENSTTYCTSCQMGLYLTTGHECLINCPSNEFKFSADGKCYLVCPDGYYGNILDFTCVKNCPNGTFIKSYSNLCESCSFDCQTCFQTSFYCGSCKYGWLAKAPYCSLSESNFFFFFSFPILNIHL